MTFTTRVKDEISKIDNTNAEIIAELSAFFRYCTKVKKMKLKL